MALLYYFVERLGTGFLTCEVSARIENYCSFNRFSRQVDRHMESALGRNYLAAIMSHVSQISSDNTSR